MLLLLSVAVRSGILALLEPHLDILVDQVGNPEVDLEKLEFLCLKIGNSC